MIGSALFRTVKILTFYKKLRLLKSIFGESKFVGITNNQVKSITDIKDYS